MRRSIYNRLVSTLLCMGLLSPANAQGQEAETDERQVEESPASPPVTPKKKKKKAPPPIYFSSLGLGKTLPEGFYRIRSISRFGQGNRQIDSEGKAQDIGYELSAVGTALAIEYGMSDDFSFQLAIPYVAKNSIAFNRRAFQNSNTYANSVRNFEDRFYGLLAAQNICASREACKPIIDGGLTLPSIPLTLPTGEVQVIPGQRASDTLNLIPQLVTRAATPSDGQTGIGDVEFGILYSVLQSRHHVFALGAGLRLPFGAFQDVPRAQRPTGEGLLQFGLRLNYDYHPTPALWLSFQNLSEFVVLEGKRRKTSLLDPTQLNTADPTTDAAIAAGSDGDPNLQSVTRKGVGQVGQFRADLGLSKLGSFWQPIAIEAALAYRLTAPEYYGPTKVSDGEQRFSLLHGVKFDGLGLDRPFPGYVRILRDSFLGGKNVPLQVDSFIIEFALYRSF